MSSCYRCFLRTHGLGVCFALARFRRRIGICVWLPALRLLALQDNGAVLVSIASTLRMSLRTLGILCTPAFWGRSAIVCCVLIAFLEYVVVSIVMKIVLRTK